MSDQETKTETAIDVATGTLHGELVPGVTEEMVPYKDVDAEEKARIDALMAEIDISDANSVIFFG